MLKKYLFFFFITCSICVFGKSDTYRKKNHDLNFKTLAKTWDEGIPLGNGMIGAIVWQKENKLRFALDRADLWDLRKVDEFNKPEFKYSWIISQVNKNDVSKVQKYFDEPYEKIAYPTKIPAAAIEFNFPGVNDVKSVSLSLNNALCKVEWINGIVLQTFVQANKDYGWFMLKGIPDSVKPEIISPPYSASKNAGPNSTNGPEGDNLASLGYTAPVITQNKNEIKYHQECSGGMFYDVIATWKSINNVLIGYWTINTNRPYILSSAVNGNKPGDVNKREFLKNFKEHCNWWNNYWTKSSIKIPDEILETQYYRDLYKFGCTSHKGAPPITLQAVWSADNGRIPPWKGDFHNDLNTQLSYWPSYSSNHLDEASSFTDWLWSCRDAAKDYTRKFFEAGGLNFPGVSTLTGIPMGGWVQYACSPTVSAWLAQHFYLQWRYSMDEKFLKERAYPWVKDAAQYIDEISIRDADGRKRLPLSSSPEINDNKIDAWFKQTTNYDLALIRWLYKAAAEMAREQGLDKDADKWNSLLKDWPELAVSSTDKKLLVAPGYELKYSHRHFSQLMAIHPLGILDFDAGEKDRDIITSSIADLEKLGTSKWCGYSFAWLGSMYARALMGEKAASALKTFSTCFCSPNSFHLNGDQSKTGKSDFTYRPFTLEGNFAFASGIQEMLMQSQNGLLKIFPALPEQWADVEFNKLRAEGAFVVSAKKEKNKFETLKIYSEKGGTVKIKNPFSGPFSINGKSGAGYLSKDSIIVIATKKGETLLLKNS